MNVRMFNPPSMLQAAKLARLYEAYQPIGPSTTLLFKQNTSEPSPPKHLSPKHLSTTTCPQR